MEGAAANAVADALDWSCSITPIEIKPHNSTARTRANPPQAIQGGENRGKRRVFSFFKEQSPVR
jgi:hypothetical protein